MGIIAPTQNTALAKKPQGTKRILSDALIQHLSESVCTENGDYINIAQGIANRLCDIALFAESNKDATSAAKVIFDRIEGKTPVQNNEEKQVLPAVVFRLDNKEQSKVKELAALDEPEEEPARVIVELDDGTGMEI